MSSRNPSASALLSLHPELIALIFLFLPTSSLVALTRACKLLHQAGGAIEEALRRRAGESWLPASLPEGEPSWTTLLLWLERRRSAPRQTLAGGYDHSVFVSRRGQVLACGHAEGGPAAWRIPTPLKSLAVRIQSVSAGSGFTLALGWLGAVFAWGKCTHGSLGHGNLIRQRTPKLIAALRGVRVEVVAAGEHHACAASREGVLWVWGSAEEGRLGLPAVTRGREPVPIGWLCDGVHAQPGHGREGGGWAGRVDGAAGVRAPPEADSRVSGAACGCDRNARPPTLATIRALASSNHTLAATSAGCLFSWGRRGALGHGGSGASPQRVSALSGVRIVSVAASPSHSLAVTAQGWLFSFGSGESGQLGHCDWEPQPVPSRVMSLAAVVVTAVACGDYCSFALSAEGAVYSWGLSPSLGHGQHGAAHVEEPAPRRVEALRAERVAAIAAGPAHVLAACYDGRAYGWGIGCDETLGLPQLGGGDALLPVAYDLRMRVDVGPPGAGDG